MAATISHGADTTLRPPASLDYSLIGANSTLAVERGLAEAEWYQCSVPVKPFAACCNGATDPPSAIRFCGLLSSWAAVF
jgi:hypothetical protein